MTASHHWVTAWAGSIQGPYPVGSPIAQPDLSLAIPDPALGLRDQWARMVVRPGLWSSRCRIRMSNAFGTQSLHLRGISVALRLGAAALVPGTSVGVTFGLSDEVRLQPGEVRWSDPVELSWVESSPARLAGQDLAVTYRVEGASGALSWHAKAMSTSYLGVHGAKNGAAGDGEEAFPSATTSWYLLDAVDMWLPSECRTLVAFGDSLTDGTNTTLNGYDRWPDVLQRRLRLAGDTRTCLVNAGIGGNQVVGPKGADGTTVYRGGPPAVLRLERDVLSLSGVDTVFWLEGINDFSAQGGFDAATVLAGVEAAVNRLRSRGIKVLGATVPSAFRGKREGHGSEAQDRERRAFNDALRTGREFDALIDLDAVLTDPSSGTLRAEFDKDSTFGGPGDGVHPNREGHAAMAAAIGPRVLSI